MQKKWRAMTYILPLEGKTNSGEFGSRFVLDTSKNFLANEAMQQFLGVLNNIQDQHVKVAVHHI